MGPSAATANARLKNILPPDLIISEAKRRPVARDAATSDRTSHHWWCLPDSRHGIAAIGIAPPGEKSPVNIFHTDWPR